MAINKLCIDCTEECKQEAHAKIISCSRVQAYKAKIKADKKKGRLK